ncbi:acetamidase/formamidase family protein [Halopseudomonas pelagia]|uniref:Amidase n=1 Tax=Halopseudomonas pelagia TaxID=553151 RepID=A0AA91TZK6_9GAMM|nr:acetamidase/formamidase family protein [Halopseudomonas pelagia]PCC97899.1 amidase [Halopseudomonas pelagia]QFY56164.1 amidase [Halopseudomonas pelagia]
MSRHHVIPTRYQNMLWGYLEAGVPSVLRIQSGDTVELSSFPAGGYECLPADRSRVPKEYLEALEALEQGSGPHFVTGPVYVDGAMPGDVLQVDILDARPTMDWGYMAIQPPLGSLPDDFVEERMVQPDIDIERGITRLPWGMEIDLDPFFGIMAVAPPAEWGSCSSSVPMAFGGNMDNKELKPSTTLFLPVFNEGAQFFAGDGHGVQGDGEVCLTALEMGITGRFRLTIRRNMTLTQPFAESATHLISIGLNEDLDEAARQAVREMIMHVQRHTALSREEAYMLCSVAGDLRISQLVDGNKGVHMMLPKRYL